MDKLIQVWYKKDKSSCLLEKSGQWKNKSVFWGQNKTVLNADFGAILEALGIA